LLLACLAVFAKAQTRVMQAEGKWQIENPSLRLTVQPEEGKILVLDKRCNYLWKQPEEVKTPIRNV
jgi:hypothetical protein